jgi:hypothetical protein
MLYIILNKFYEMVPLNEKLYNLAPPECHIMDSSLDETVFLLGG